MTDGLAPLVAWLRAGRPASSRMDFPAGTAMPDGRLDMCKKDVGVAGVARVVDALRPGTVRHLLLGTDRLGDTGAVTAARAADAGVNTLYLGCNGITGDGAYRVADRLRASPQALTGIWLKRNPLGASGAPAAAMVASAPELRVLDLVQTGLDASGVDTLAEALAHHRLDQLYLDGNPLGSRGAASAGRLITSGAVGMLYLSAAGIGDAGADALAEALVSAPYGALERLSVASDGIGPVAAARLTIAAIDAGVSVVDLGRVRAAAFLGAPDNRLDAAAIKAVGAALANGPHQTTHVIVTHTGLRSRDVLPLFRHAERAVAPTRFVVGAGVAASIRRRLAASSGLPALPPPPPGAAAVASVHRTAR